MRLMSRRRAAGRQGLEMPCPVRATEGGRNLAGDLTSDVGRVRSQLGGGGTCATAVVCRILLFLLFAIGLSV